MQLAPPISVLIRCHNEADRIQRSLDAVTGLGREIVVIDSGSTDGTIEIAQAAGARVIQHAWDGFGPQRHFGEDQCVHDWIFYLDADEVPTPELRQEIRELFTQGEPAHAAYEIRNTMVLPGNIRPCLFADFRMVTRLTNRRYARVSLEPSWDRVEVAAGRTTGILLGRQWHYSFRSWHHAISKIDYTAGLAARTQLRKSRWLLRLRLITEYPMEFLKFYFVRRFVFAGWKGLCFSAIQAFSRLVRIKKMLAIKH
jgi:glycosyltransferase involved in cell wall biosynthesis